MTQCTRRRLLLALPVALAVLLACAWLVWPRTAITRENAEKIQVGMTIAEVEALLGGPARTENTGPVVLDIEAPGASEAMGQPDGSERADCVRLRRWASDTVTIDLCLCREGRVVAVRVTPMLRESESPLDLLRRWLGL
jgi:hypothetical protein